MRDDDFKISERGCEAINIIANDTHGLFGGHRVRYTVFIGGHWSWRNVHTAQPHKRCGNRHSLARKEKEKPGEPGTWKGPLDPLERLAPGTICICWSLLVIIYHVRAYLPPCLLV